jgi:2-polyprenyl-3-methyl-5-hydroxy-6-metoxy-1,4-benzoquinol methylase
MRIYTPKDNIYLPSESLADFNYSDGDEAENYILGLINASADISTGSEELISGIKDWPSAYHLSPRRADLLRPLAGLLHGKNILEIGSGCGAITRYLGELGGRITALEGSHRRATITRARTRELVGITVICDNFQDFDTIEKFDVITLIGVLEYSNLFIDADHPPEAMLQKIKTFLNPGGRVIIAIENKLGLKYLAGAPEDHTDKPYFGIENKYTSSTVTTFGKDELIQLLEKSGLPHSSFFYPFPDYKLPSVVLTEKGVMDDSFFVGELLSEKLEYFQTNVYVNNFSTTLAAEAFAQNHLLSHFSNSFLVVASLDEESATPAGNILAYSYSSHRRKSFCKENIFERNRAGQINVIKKRLYDQAPPPGLAIRQIVENEVYREGVLLSKLLINLVSRNGWTIEDLHPWAQAYYIILCKHAIFKDSQGFLEGKYADLTPFNILLKDGSDFSIFDQEWIISEDLPLYYVFFRGVRFSLGDLSFFSAPADGTPQNLLELSIAIVNTAFTFTPTMLDHCLELEKKYFAPVNFGELLSFDCGDIRIRGPYQLERKLQHQQEQLNSQVIELNESQSITRQLQEDLASLRNESDYLRSQLDASQKEKDWFIRTYKERSLLGLLRERIRFFK